MQPSSKPAPQTRVSYINTTLYRDIVDLSSRYLGDYLQKFLNFKELCEYIFWRFACDNVPPCSWHLWGAIPDFLKRSSSAAPLLRSHPPLELPALQTTRQVSNQSRYISLYIWIFGNLNTREKTRNNNLKNELIIIFAMFVSKLHGTIEGVVVTFAGSNTHVSVWVSQASRQWFHDIQCYQLFPQWLCVRIITVIKSTEEVANKPLLADKLLFNRKMFCRQSHITWIC